MTDQDQPVAQDLDGESVWDVVIAAAVRESDRQLRAEMIERLHHRDCHHHPLSDHTPDVAEQYGQQVDAVVEVAAGFRRGAIATWEPSPGDETCCHRCGGPNRPWSVPSPLWNEVMRGGSINGDEIHEGIVCPTCFVVLAEQVGVASLWRLTAERITAELETVTPSGRVWDERLWKWRDPHAHACLSCSPDGSLPGPGCLNCRQTGMDQTPCQEEGHVPQCPHICCGGPRTAETTSGSST